MKPSRWFAVMVLLSLAGIAVADRERDKLDFTRPETPPKPAPKWLKLVDLGKYDKRLAGYKAPEGVKVEIVAAAPTVVNPVGMTFSDDGTPYVLEWRPSPGDETREKVETFTYKDGKKRNVTTASKRVKDVVKVLRDSKGKGVYDEAKVVLEDELPSSILLHDGWLYLSGRGTVRRYKQSKADGPYDVKEVIAQGFGGFGHHQVSGMTLGLDGLLYLTTGDGDHHVEGSDGSRATVLRSGAIFRCKPDGSKMETFAQGFLNPYRDGAFDSTFNLFHADNDSANSGKFAGCRLMHVAEGSDFGWRLGSRSNAPDPMRAAVYGELPGKVPPLAKTGRGAPSGLFIYNDTRLPEMYRGLLFNPDVVRQTVRAFRVENDGASFSIAEEFTFLSAPKDPLFRPCQMVLGPDGAIYLVDWRSDSNGAGKMWGDGKNGRIYRISWAGTKEVEELKLRETDSWSKIRKLSEDDLLATLSSEEASFRDRARWEIVKRGDKMRPALLKILNDSDKESDARLAALGALQSMWDADVQKAVLKQLDSGTSDLRRLCADALALHAKRGDLDVHNVLVKALADNDLSVRRAVAMTMSRVDAPGTADALVNALTFDDGDDLVLRDGLVRAIEGLGKDGIGRLLEMANSGSQKDLDKLVMVYTGLRTKPAADALPTLLKNPHLDAGQRAAVLRSFANYLFEPAFDPGPIETYLIANPKEPASVRLAGLEVLALAGGTRGEKASKEILESLDAKDTNTRFYAIRAIESIQLAKTAERLVKMLIQGDRSEREREALVRAIRALRDSSAVKPLELSLEKGLPTSAEEAALQGALFRVLAGLDSAAATPFAERFLESSDLEAQREAVRILGIRVDGARKMAKRYLDKKLPHELLPDVHEALLKFADRDEEMAKLLDAVMKEGMKMDKDKKDPS